MKLVPKRSTSNWPGRHSLPYNDHAHQTGGRKGCPSDCAVGHDGSRKQLYERILHTGLVKLFRFESLSMRKSRGSAYQGQPVARLIGECLVVGPARMTTGESGGDPQVHSIDCRFKSSKAQPSRAKM